MSAHESKLSRSDSDLMHFAACASDYVSLITDRWDIVVKAGKGLGKGAPACFIPATAEIEINADSCMSADAPRLDKIGWRIGAIDLVRPKHRALVPVTTGALIHECGHSLYSLWPFDPAMKDRIKAEPAQVHQLAIALEEGRQEARIAKREPGHIAYLQRTLNAIIIPGMPKTPPEDPFALLHAAALLYPRQRYGLPVDTRDLNRWIDAACGPGTAEYLSDTLGGMRAAFWSDSADSDDTVLRIAREWWEKLPESAKESGGSGEDKEESCPAHGSDESKAGSGSGRDALEATKKYARSLEDVEKTSTDKEAVAEARDSEKSVGGKEASEKRSKGPKAHGHSMSALGSGVIGRRMPTPVEVSTSKRLSAILKGAQTVSRVKAASALPPGRLRGRSAIEWSRDRSMERATTVKLWKGKTKGDDIPPVRLGIAMDVSGSMGGYADVSASLGWTLASSAWDAEALVSGVCFGASVYPYVEVGRAFREVKTLGAHDGTELVHSALIALDKELDLIKGVGPRVLILISDGGYVHPEERRNAAKWLTDYVRSGGVLIYVGLESSIKESHYMDGFPKPGKAGGVYEVPAKLETLVTAIGSVIRRAYSRL